MIVYGKKESFRIRVERVDTSPEIAGIKLPYLLLVGTVPSLVLILELPKIAMALFFGLIFFSIHASKREDAGRSLFFHPAFIRTVFFMPPFLRETLFKGTSAIRPHVGRHRLS